MSQVAKSSVPSFFFPLFFSVWFGRPVASYFFSLVFLSLQLSLPSFYLSPLGDLGIGLLWDNHQPTAQLFRMSVEIFFKLNKTNYKVSSQDVLRCSQFLSDVPRCSQGAFRFSDILLTFAIWSKDVSGCCREAIKVFSHVLRCSRTFSDALNMFSERCSQDVFRMFLRCSQGVLRFSEMFSAQDFLRMFSGCSQDVLSMYSRCSEDVLTIYYWYSCVYGASWVWWVVWVVWVLWV